MGGFHRASTQTYNIFYRIGPGAVTIQGPGAEFWVAKKIKMYLACMENNNEVEER